MQKVALVTGSATGAGRACAVRFAKFGYAVVVNYSKSEADANETAALVKACGVPVLVHKATVADDSQVRAMVERTRAEFGGIDVLVNNAGANHRGPIEDVTAEELAHIVAVNLSAPVVLTRLALPHLRKSTAAAVVNVASLAGRVPVFHEATYSATKFGLRAFSFALDEELREVGVRVAVVSPGPVDTGFINQDIAAVPDLVFSQPMATAEEIAELIVESALGGRSERVIDPIGGYVTTLGYLFPSLRRVMRPVMERVGRQRKERYLARK